VSLSRRGAPQRISPTTDPGVHSYNVSPSGRFAVHTYSRFGVPPVAQLVSLPEHRVLRTLVDNAALKAKVAGLRLGTAEFTQVDIGDGIRLNAYLIKPPNFDPNRKYPVFFTVYGGPGSQTVLDAWGGQNFLWHEMLAQRGYIIASVDNRGTGARGRAWRKIIYKQMGVIETQDQAAAARAIGRLPYVDSTRIGIWGWSYGGFMSLNVITQAPDVYRMAIAVAPVTHWKFYDTIYTERYNGLPQDNAAGYDRGSPLTYAKNLRGKLLIVHGSGDDNVHYQNTETMVNALVAANKPFQLMVYPNRTHSISGGTTRQHLFTLLTQFVEQNLPAGEMTRTPQIP
jgi:dipeptidyl-peptidase-4